MDHCENIQKLAAANQYLVTEDELTSEPSYFLDPKCHRPSEVTSIEIHLPDKKLPPIDYEPVFRDLHENDKLLQTCGKDEDDGFILSEFQLDHLEPLALSPETMALASDILPSSSVQASSSIICRIPSDLTVDVTSDDHLGSQQNLPIDVIKMDKEAPPKDNFLKQQPSCALVFNVLSKPSEEGPQSPKLKGAKKLALKKKRNKVLLNCNVEFDSNNVINNNARTNREEDDRVTVAISTDKVSNVTQIVINNGRQEQIYQSKTTELLQAASKSPEDESLGGLNESDSAGSYNQGHDLAISKALEELGISDESLQPSNVTEQGKVWHCPREDCARKFTRIYALKCHLLMHYGIRPFKCDFEGCTWSFFSEFKLKRHKETHLKKKDYICKIAGCKRRFTTVYNLWSHEKLHSRPSKITCHVPDCLEKFQTKRALELHMKCHDQSHAPYVCQHSGCNKRYYSNNALTSHQRCHSYKDADVKCSWPGCGKLFDKPCRLKAHMRSHTGCKPYPCTFPDCHWAFSSSSKLKRHQKKHTNERKFVCDAAACGKAFMRSEHLKEHKLTHNEARLFRCALCDAKFSAKSSLYVHIKKHHKKEQRSEEENAAAALQSQMEAALGSQIERALGSQIERALEARADNGGDYVFYMDKMVMLTAPCEAVVFGGKAVEGAEEVEEEGVREEGSARTRLTRSDVSRMKESVAAQGSEVADDILGSTDGLGEGLLFSEDLSSMYYEGGIEGTECQVLLLDSNASEVMNLKDFD